MKNKGFTLVELSIVLVIIGLLIGGILAAQSMVSTAKISKIVKQFSEYDVAIANFHTKYNKWPGDTNLFPKQATNVLTNNNTLDYGGELGDLWSHLSLGVDLKKPDGTNYPVYTYNTTVITEKACPYLDIEQNKTDPSCMVVIDRNMTLYGASYTAGQKKYFQYYSEGCQYSACPTPDSFFYGYATYKDYDPLLAKDAASLDNKIDNGLPYTGNVLGGGIGVSTVGNCIAGSRYNVSNTSFLCSLFVAVGSFTGHNQ